MTSFEPSLPYAGTSGHSGTDTSRARAVDADTSGRTATTQERVLELVTVRGSWGLTIVEARKLFAGIHHGTLSGALTALHKRGDIARLVQKRNRAKIYVAPGRIYGRETEAPNTNRTYSDGFRDGFEAGKREGR